MLWQALLLIPHTAFAQPAESLWVDLGPANDSHGVVVPSDGDGVNEPAEIAGSPCRRTAGERSLYTYIVVDDALAPAGDYDAYLTVEYYDSHVRLIRVEYDRAGGSAYDSGDDAVILGLGSGAWRRTTVRLEHAAFSGRQNWGADLRLASPGLAVRRIEVAFAPPVGYRPESLSPDDLAAFGAQAGEGMAVTFGGTASQPEALLYKALGVTAVESYVTWQTVEDAAEGEWDWSRWDRQVEILEGAGLKWVPFLIVGPAYANPKWFREAPDAVPYVCLEHGEASKVESLWSPRLPERVDRFLQAFAERYRDRGVIQSVLLGVTGIYGESIYPAGPPDGWTMDIPGPYHNHGGWWAGDRYAAESFRRALQERYGAIDALNAAWGATYADMADVRPFPPDRAPSPRARADMVRWYVDSMTAWSEFWVATTRKHFPDTEILLCTGGDANPFLGADFTAQARAIAPYEAGIRITNEGSDYAANFTVTREVATACRAYGTPFGFEPASGVDPRGVIARIYNATASGASELHYYTDNVLGEEEAVANYRAYVGLLERRAPTVRAGVYLPKTSWALEPAALDATYGLVRRVRDFLDVEMVDTLLLELGALPDLRVLAVAGAPWAEASECDRLRRWVEEGGVLVVLPGEEGVVLRTPEGDDAFAEERLAAPEADLRLSVARLEGPAPTHVRLSIGSPDDEGFLFGEWHGRETGGEWPDVPEATKRWTGARPGALLPADPDRDATLIVSAHVSGRSQPAANRVFVNGHEVGRLTEAGNHDYRFAVPRELLEGAPVAEVTMDLATWVPSDFGMGDGRSLGAAIREIRLFANGHEDDAPATPRVAFDLDAELLRERCVRRVGRGLTITIPAARRASDAAAQAMALALANPAALGLDAAPVKVPDGRADGIFVTQTDGGLVLYNATAEARTAFGLEIPAYGMVVVPPER